MLPLIPRRQMPFAETAKELVREDGEKMGEALAEELQTEVAFTIPLFGGIPVHESIVVMWGIMAFVMIAVLLLTRNLKIVPGRGQAMLESAVTWVNNFLEGNMGKAGRPYFAYLGTVLLCSAFPTSSGCSASVLNRRPKTSTSRLHLHCSALS